MAGRVAIIWDTPVLFTRLAEDCGYLAELVTPHLLAAPFFKRAFSAIIIPSGFAHPSYSSVLPALRACEGRIRRFIISGGTVLVFGAGFDRPDAYDWLPVPVQYRFGFSEGVPEPGTASPLTCITDECPEVVSTDGFLSSVKNPGSGLDGAQCSGTGADGEIVLRVNGEPVLIAYSAGAGKIILTTLHEYPSRQFLRNFCTNHGETLL